MNGLQSYMNHVADGIALIGGAVILLGTLVAVVGLVRTEIGALRGGRVLRQRQVLRHRFGYYILLGLEFLIAADVIRTLIHPGMDELVTLGVIVAIRTVISLTLNWELTRRQRASGDPT